MRKSEIRLFAGLTALLLVSALISGCGGNGKGTGSSGSEKRELVDSEIDSAGGDSLESDAGSSGGAVSQGQGGGNSAVSPGSGSAASVPSEQGSTGGKYPPLGADVMPIGAWVAPPRAGVKNNNPSFITDAQYKMLGESGINLIYSLYENYGPNSEEVKQSLDLCQKYGLKYLVRDANINEPDEESMRETLQEYAKHPAFAGVNVRDEPGTVSFEQFGEQHVTFKKLAPDKYFYINLLPSYATPAQLLYGAATSAQSGTVTHTEYLDRFIKTVKPRFLSYDYYAINGAAGTVQNGYFKELSTFRKLGLQNNIPFWVFVQACSYGGASRRPNRAEIMWQVNTSLAYGAKGIQYFCYFTPIESDDFQGSFIDKNGRKTEIYTYGQEANRQIAAVDDVLMNSVSKGVIVTGKSPDSSIPAGDKLSKYGSLTDVTASGSGFLTGCFDCGGKNVFYVVNNSITSNGTVTLKFSKSVSGRYVYNAASRNFSGLSLALTLNAGEGVLVALS